MQRCPTVATPGVGVSRRVFPRSLYVSLPHHQRRRRLIDSAGNDLEPDGYITFYTVDPENDDSAAPGRTSELREYRARFSSGQLQNIVRVDADRAETVRYGLASFRWFSNRARFSLAIRMSHPTRAKGRRGAGRLEVAQLSETYSISCAPTACGRT